MLWFCMRTQSSVRQIARLSSSSFRPSIQERSFRVAIIGRPNVGKSALFNRLVGKRQALVHNKPGVTRDCMEGTANLGPIQFQVVDTAGLDDGVDMQGQDMDYSENAPQKKASGIGRWPAHLLSSALSNTTEIVKASDVVLFVVDTRTGLTPLDHQFAKWANRLGRATLLVSNKCDGNTNELEAAMVHKLGLGEPLYVSAEHKEGLSELTTLLLPFALRSEPLTPVEDSLTPEEALLPRFAILGKPNAGKSTLVNTLSQDSREGMPPLLVGPEPGITRDPINLTITYNGERMVLVDTAGLRKKGRVISMGDQVDIATSAASMRKIKEVDVCLVLLDASRQDQLMHQQDLAIINAVIDAGKGLVLVVNKSDTLSEQQKHRILKTKDAMLADRLSEIGQVPLVCVSGQTGEGLANLMETALEVHRRFRFKASSNVLMRWLVDLKRVGVASRLSDPTLKFARQVDSAPPTFVISCSRAEKASGPFLAFLRNSLRDRFGLDGIPLNIHVREADKKDTGKKVAAGGRRKR